MVQEDLDHLKRQPEWQSVINYLFNDLITFQEVMIGDTDPDRLLRRSARGYMAKKYLIWALEPTKEQGGKHGLEMD